MLRCSFQDLCRSAAGLFVLPLVLLLTGCQEQGRSLPSGKVGGSITVAGEPLAEGRVNFASEEGGFGASGMMQPDGTYTLEGPIPAGSYKVFITFDIAPADRGTAAEDVLKSVPAKYQSQATSDLTAEVLPDANECSFELDAPT